MGGTRVRGADRRKEGMEMGGEGGKGDRGGRAIGWGGGGLVGGGVEESGVGWGEGRKMR